MAEKNDLVTGISTAVERDSSSDLDSKINEKYVGVTETASDPDTPPGYSKVECVDGAELYVPLDNEEFIDPRLKDYSNQLVAKTVDLHNDPTEPILTFRFWVLSTFWVIVGCAISTFYYFKPFAGSLSSYAIQLLAWGMGDLMSRYLPNREFNTFGYRWNMNPSPFNKKEHALIVVAYWGSCYTAYGLGPLSALELYYGEKINAGWSILFLISTQMIGYGFAGTFRDILVRPPKMVYPGVLPNVALFNAMHKNPTVTKNSLKFFAIVATCFFVYEWFPQLIFPVLGSLPLICWFGHGNAIAYTLGSGNYGFGILDFSLDWNYINSGVLQPMYSPLWATVTQSVGAIFAVWLLYPILYYTNFLDSMNFPAMTTSTLDNTGSPYNISAILTPDYRLNATAMAEYSQPYWATSYVFYWFWGFAASAGGIVWAGLWYGPDAYRAIVATIKTRGRDNNDYNDPYLKLMSFDPRVPHWWYLALLAVCTVISLVTLYCGGFQLPWWGFIVMALIAWVFTFPNGVLWGIANQQIGMSFLADLIAGSLFHGSPKATLSALVYSRQILEQNLNLISDYKFGFYMKIPEREMFIAQVWGTLIGPFINVALMQTVLNQIPHDELTGATPSVSWYAALTRNYYSTSVLWGIIGPQTFFSPESGYRWVYYAFWVGPLAVLAVYAIQRMRPRWNLDHYANMPLFFYGMCTYPVYPTTNLLTPFIAGVMAMGVVFKYRPVYWRKYHYLFSVGADCGTQIMQTVMILAVSLPGLTFPYWWGNQPTYIDRCFAPNAELPAAMQM